MDNLISKKQNLIFNSIFIVLVFSLVYLLGLAINLSISIPVQLLLVILVSFLIKFIIFNPIVFYAALTIVFLIILLVNHYVTPFLFSFMDRVYYLFSNIINNLLGKQMIFEENILLFWVILLVTVCLFTAIVIFKIKKIYLLIPVYFSVYLYYWYNFYDQAFWMISIFLISYLILMGIIKYSREINEFDGSIMDFEKLYTPWLRTTTTYAIIIVIISLFLPKSYNYIQWPWLQKKVYTAFPIVEELRSYNSYKRDTGGAAIFDFSITGFQPSSSKLGGPVVLSNKKIMTVQAKSASYLRGNVKHKYTGNSWESVNESWINYTIMQDFSELSQEEKYLYYIEEDIIITNHDFASTTLFSPYMPQIINLLENSLISIGKDYTLNLSKGIYDNESYYIRVLKPLPYGMLLSLGIDDRKEDIDGLDIYLQIPDNIITTRTKDLVKEIVVHKESDFDKAKAIENHLRNNYEYNLIVNVVPEDKEFIDYFLFEEKKGYCTYFATSMAMMLRLEGIPARYVEGYLAHNMVEDGVYEVRQQDAHAWVEAFIEPVGWMTFEATPVYQVEDRLEGYEIEEVNPDIDIISENIDSGKHPKGTNDDPNLDFELDIGVGGWDFDRENPFEDTTSLTKNSLLIILGVLLSIIPIRFIIGFIKYKYNERLSRKFSNNKRIVYLYSDILKLIAQLGFPQQFGETHFEYAQRIAYKFYDHEKKGIKEITTIFVKSKYSNSLASNDDLLILEKYRLDLEKRLKNYLGKRLYYYNKYFLTKS